MSMNRHPLLCCLLMLLVIPVGVMAEGAVSPTVGMPGKLQDVVLPGTELEAKPYEDRKTPVILRVLSVIPHGTAFRYDFEFIGLDPGVYDLRDYLRRKDKSPLGDLPRLEVRVDALRPAGQILPNELVVAPAPSVGGYRLWRTLALIAWAAIFFLFLYFAFFRKRSPLPGDSARSLSLAERLRPLVTGACRGELTRAELASLERVLIAFWKKRLGLLTASPEVAMRQLREHPEASSLLLQLERWLHQPEPETPSDLEALLRPYRDLPVESLDEELPAPIGGNRS